jgi:hypothetical protein
MEEILTKSQRQHRENLERQARNRAKRKHTQEEKIERDAKLAEINNKYMPAIQALQAEYNAEKKKVWDEWRKSRETSQ